MLARVLLGIALSGWVAAQDSVSKLGSPVFGGACKVCLRGAMGDMLLRASGVLFGTPACHLNHPLSARGFAHDDPSLRSTENASQLFKDYGKDCVRPEQIGGLKDATKRRGEGAAKPLLALRRLWRLPVMHESEEKPRLAVSNKDKSSLGCHRNASK